MCREALGFLEGWRGEFPEDVEGVLEAMKRTGL